MSRTMIFAVCMVLKHGKQLSELAVAPVVVYFFYGKKYIILKVLYIVALLPKVAANSIGALCKLKASCLVVSHGVIFGRTMLCYTSN